MSGNGIYNGSSESMTHIVDCYVEYAKEVISSRAFPDLRDGLKTVQRRILYGLKLAHKPYLQKCAVVISESMKLHPHSDGSVWGAFSLMTDANGSFNMPLFHGDGYFGRVWSNRPPAAFRYPLYMLNENAEEYFKDSEIMDLKPSEEGEGMEVVVFPVTYPSVLVNGGDGIAVSVATKMPSFNFGDVIDLTVKYLQNGELGITDIIVPDFPCGGILVRDDTEIAKIMATGKGKLKIRAKVEIQGKNIYVDEVPHGKTVESIINAIKRADITGIASVGDIHGRTSTHKIVIECKAKKWVELILMELYRRNILQNIFASNITVTEDGEPFILGVHDLVKRWCSWRSEILKRKFKLIIDRDKKDLVLYKYFNDLISNEENKIKYVNLIAKQGKKAAGEFLREVFQDIPDDVVKWISNREIGVFHSGGSYAKRYEEILKELDYYTEAIKDPSQYIIDELIALKKKNKGKYERKTEVTYLDYKFSKVADSDVIEDTSYCVWTLMRDGFLRKTRFLSEDSNVLCQFEGCANSVLVGFDNYGRVLKVQGSEIEFTAGDSKGTYMPKYFDVLGRDEYKVLYLGLLDGTKRMLVYKDGYVGFFDTSEWVGKKVIKVIQNGVPTYVFNKLLEVYEEKDIPQYLLVADEYGEEEDVRLGLAYVDDIAEKSRRSRTKVFYGVDPDISYLKGFDYIELTRYIEDPEQYLGKLKIMKGDFYGDPSEMEDGRYLDLCVDLPEGWFDEEEE